MKNQYAPCLAQSDVGDTILVTERKIQRAVLVKLAAIEPETLLKRLEHELPLAERWFCFARHLA